MAPLTVGEVMVVQAGEGKKKPGWIRALKEEKIREASGDNCQGRVRWKQIGMFL